MGQQSKTIDLTDKTFGYLTVLRRAGNSGKYAAWLCRCTCGTEIIASGDRLRRGRNKSCARNGHRWLDPDRGTATTINRLTHNSWRRMIARCENQKGERWLNYGGRGITVCARWRRSFTYFLTDMGPRPSKNHSIERDDVNGNYELGNCRWATAAEQSRNQRRSVKVIYEGKRMLLLDVVAQLGLSRSVVYARLKLGWPLEQALALPVRAPKKKQPKLPKLPDESVWNPG